MHITYLSTLPVHLKRPIRTKLFYFCFVLQHNLDCISIKKEGKTKQVHEENNICCLIVKTYFFIIIQSSGDLSVDIKLKKTLN